MSRSKLRGTDTEVHKMGLQGWLGQSPQARMESRSPQLSAVPPGTCHPPKAPSHTQDTPRSHLTGSPCPQKHVTAKAPPGLGGGEDSRVQAAGQ